MKPRRNSVPLTDEDQRIWSCVCCFNFHLPARLYGRDVCAEKAAQDADRRDADRMLIMTRARVGLNHLKKTAHVMYDGLTPHEQEVMRRLFGTRRP